MCFYFNDTLAVFFNKSQFLKLGIFLDYTCLMKNIPIKELLSNIKYPLFFLFIIWLVFFMDNFFKLNLYTLGICPRTLNGLKGILFSPFIHADINHILNNSLPILILGSMIFYFYKPIAWSSITWIYIISGIWLWIGGRNNAITPHYHFGASSLIYGFATFLFFSGVFRKHKELMMVSAFVVFTYGSITWGIFPIDRSISWEGHLFGSVAGILVAYNYRKDGPQSKVYEWPEEEIDLEAIANQELLEEQIERDSQRNESSLEQSQIVYHYKPTEQKNSLNSKE